MSISIMVINKQFPFISKFGTFKNVMMLVFQFLPEYILLISLIFFFPSLLLYRYSLFFQIETQLYPYLLKCLNNSRISISLKINCNYPSLRMFWWRSSRFAEIDQLNYSWLLILAIIQIYNFAQSIYAIFHIHLRFCGCDL